MTSAELRLWRALRRNAMNVRFRKQHPIGPYVADFACYTHKLVVEVDGATHSSPAELAHDRRRRAYLERLGWHVLRVTNEAVYMELDDALDLIADTLRDLRPHEQRERGGD